MTPQSFADNLIAPNKQVGFNQADFGQCTAIPQLWLAPHKLPFLVGNAIDLPNAADPKYFEVYDYIPGFQVLPGDIIIWAECDPIGVGINGHTDLYINDLGNGHWRGCDQNWPVDSPPRYVTHTWQGVVKIIRIKQEYMVEVMDSEDAKDCYRLGLHREPENDQVWRPLVGKKFSDEAVVIRASTEWLTQNDILLRAYPQALQTINDLNAKIQQLEAQPTPQAVSQIKQESQAILDTASHLGSQQ